VFVELASEFLAVAEGDTDRAEVDTDLVLDLDRNLCLRCARQSLM
jgi:hypothetical protein